MSELIGIPIQDSLLFSKAFNSEAALTEHLNKHLSDDKSGLLLVQFPAQLTSLDNVSACLFMLSWIPAFMKGLHYRAQNPLRLISLRTDGDWFLEAVGRLQTCLELHQFILMRLRGELPKQQRLVKERVKQIRTVYRQKIQNATRMLGKSQFVQRVSRPVPHKEEFWAEIEVPRIVEIDKIANVPIAEVDKVIQKIKRLEIYDINKQVKAADFLGGGSA